MYCLVDQGRVRGAGGRREVAATGQVQLSGEWPHVAAGGHTGAGRQICHQVGHY